MNLELTISGLCVMVMKTTGQAKPKHPTDIDIIIPQACHHASRLSYLPTTTKHSRDVKPNLLIDQTAGKVASLDINQLALEMSFKTNPHTEFDVHWGSGGEMPSSPWEEGWLDWLPRLEELGFDPFAVGPVGTLPKGASARLTLPFGKLAARQIIKKPDTNRYLRWDFPASSVRKALANEIVLTVNGADDMRILNSDGATLLRSTLGGIRPLRMCITNDLELVPYNYGSSPADLEHLEHIGSIAGGTFQKPKEVNDDRTGRPICMSVVLVNDVSKTKRYAS